MSRHLTTTESSHLSSLRRCGVCVTLLATLLLLASSVYADNISIGLQEATVNSGMITTEATGSGNLTISGVSYGTFSVNDVSAQDFTLLGPPGLVNSQSLDISTVRPGVLTIWVTAQGLSFTGVQNFVSSFAVNTLRGSLVSVTENTYFSPTNARYGGTLLNSAVFNGIGTAGPFTKQGATSGTYSVTNQYVVFDSGFGEGGNDNITMDLSATPVPEPASFGLMGIGLAAIAAASRRRRAILP